ncbi:MAG TPA: hypothetical protein VGS41_07835, partial [Chthonomonadales bacterium]|nr:hypothetical protein [Chthonomonadales bacterium]
MATIRKPRAWLFARNNAKQAQDEQRSPRPLRFLLEVLTAAVVRCGDCAEKTNGDFALVAK